MELIIVLGSRINGSEIHDELKGRLDVAIKLFNSGSKLLLSGGITNHDLNRSEAQFMKDYCIANGIPEASIILEEKSLDTIGNGVSVPTKDLNSSFSTGPLISTEFNGFGLSST